MITVDATGNLAAPTVTPTAPTPVVDGVTAVRRVALSTVTAVARAVPSR